MLKSAIAALLALGCISAASARPLSGNYTLSYFVDPGANPGSVYCLTLVQTGGVAGYSNSGTFTDSSGVFTNGQFLVNGSSVHLIAPATTYGDTVDMIGTAKKGAFDDFIAGSAGFDIDSGTYTLVKGCTDMKLKSSVHHSTTY